MLNKRFLLISALVLSLMLTSCGGLAAPKSVKIAVSLPLGMEFPKGLLNAAQLAIKDANGKAGDINVELLVLDQSDPNGELVSIDREQQNIQQAIKDTSVVAYFGPTSSSTTKVSIPLLNEAGITHVSATATWPGLTKPGFGPGEPGVYYPTGIRNFFRTVVSDEVQGAAAARWATQLGYTSTYIVTGTGSYEQGVAGVFEITAQDLGIKVLGKDTFPVAEEMGAEQIQTIVDNVISAEPDVVYLSGNQSFNGEVMAIALRQTNADLPIMGPDGLVLDDFIKSLGPELANNIYGTTVPIQADKLDTPAAAAFVSNFEAAYNRQPNSYETATYEAINVLLYAIEHAKEPTREGVLEAMQNLGDYTGVFGTWHFDKQGDISATWVSGMQVQNGAWTFVQDLK
jgi:branched-chain amino acid transport system substrate-binding protein